MSAVLPHYKTGPANYQVAALVFGGQFVQANTQTAGTTDLTVKLAVASGIGVLGVAAKDAAPITTQTGAANSYGQPLIDISVLDDYTAVWYGGVDIWVWYSGAAYMGQKLLIGTNFGTVTAAGAGPAADQVVGVCTHPGGVSVGMLTQQIGGGAGGGGTSVYFLGRARVF